MTTPRDIDESAGIEARLQTISASLHRDRDEAHRDRQLAVERLLLAKEEEEALLKSLKTSKTELGRLKEESGYRVDLEIKAMEEEIASLRREVSFQRNELQTMTEKKNLLKEEYDACETSYGNKLSQLHSKLVECRDINHELHYAEPKLHPDKETLQEFLQDDVDHSNFYEWPRIVKNRAIAVREHESTLSTRCEMYGRIIAGYKREYGFETKPTHKLAEMPKVGLEEEPVQERGRSVTFSQVKVRQYETIMQDSPDAENGPSIGIGWGYDEERSFSVDDWEHHQLMKGIEVQDGKSTESISDKNTH